MWAAKTAAPQVILANPTCATTDLTLATALMACRLISSFGFIVLSFNFRPFVPPRPHQFLPSRLNRLLGLVADMGHEKRRFVPKPGRPHAVMLDMAVLLNGTDKRHG